MGIRESLRTQEGLWIASAELARSPGHPFYERVSELPDGENLDAFIGPALHLIGQAIRVGVAIA